jgi:hypothetical protein
MTLAPVHGLIDGHDGHEYVSERTGAWAVMVGRRVIAAAAAADDDGAGRDALRLR